MAAIVANTNGRLAIPALAGLLVQITAGVQTADIVKHIVKL